jgi:hypothetical protein
MKRSVKITTVLAAVVALIVGLSLGSTASAKNSPKELARQGLQKELPYGMPQEAKQAITTSIENVQPLVVNEYMSFYIDYYTGEPTVTTVRYDPSNVDMWTTCTNDCGTFKLVKKGKRTILVSKLTGSETLVFGNYGYTKGDLYIGSSWDGKSLPIKSTLKWMGKRHVVALQYAMIGVHNSAYPVPDYGYPAGV